MKIINKTTVDSCLEALRQHDVRLSLAIRLLQANAHDRHTGTWVEQRNALLESIGTSDELESIPSVDHKQLLDDAEERITELEAKLKAAEAWKAEARELLGTIEVASLRLGSWVKCSDWLLRRDALLAQEGGE